MKTLIKSFVALILLFVSFGLFAQHYTITNNSDCDCTDVKFDFTDDNCDTFDTNVSPVSPGTTTADGNNVNDFYFPSPYNNALVWTCVAVRCDITSNCDVGNTNCGYASSDNCGECGACSCIPDLTWESATVATIDE